MIIINSSKRIKAIKLLLQLSALILFTFLLLGLTGCSPKKPQAPEWDTQWSIPLSSKTYSITDIIDELNENNIIFDENGDPRIETRQTVDTFEVGDSLMIDGITETFSEELGEVSISSPPEETIETQLDDFLPVNQGMVPPSSFAFTSQLTTIDEFSWATISEGKLYLQVTNQLEVDLDTVIVTLRDIYDNSIVGVFNFENGLAYGDTKIDSIDLVGKTIHNQLETETVGHTPGGVLVNLVNQEIITNLSFSENLKVSAAKAKIPEINKNFNQSVQIEDSTIISSAVVKSGIMTITAANKTNLSANLNITVNDITNSNGALQFTGFIPANQSRIFTEDLNGYIITPEGNHSPQTMPVNVIADIPSSGSEFVEIDENDSISVAVNISSLSFSSITGLIKPTTVDIDPVSEDVDIPNGIDQAKLTKAVLYLNFYNASEIDADLQLNLVGDNSKSLPINGMISGRPDTQTGPYLTTITIGSEQLSDFLDPPPNRIEIGGEAVFNPDGGIGTITENDFIYGDILISSPLAFSIADTATIDLDIERQEISNDVPDFKDRAHYVTISADIISHIPVGAEVGIYLSTKSDSTLYNDPQTVIIGPMYLTPAPIDNDGYASGESSTSFVDTLTSSEAAIFDNENIYIGKRIKLYTPDDGNGITIRANDYIEITASAFAEIRMGGDN